MGPFLANPMGGWAQDHAAHGALSGKDPGYKDLVPGCKDLDPRCKGLDPGYKHLDPGYKDPAGSWRQGAGSRIQGQYWCNKASRRSVQVVALC